MDEYNNGADRSYVGFERTAKGVIVPRVKIVSGDADKAHMELILARAKELFSEALEFSEDRGAKP